MAKVHLDSVLSDFVPSRSLTSTAATLESLLEDLERRYPKLKFRIRDETRGRAAVHPGVRQRLRGQGRDRARERDPPERRGRCLHSVQGG